MEIELLSQFSHKNIVRYYGSERTKETFNIFLEYISGGTIASLLDKYGPFNENLIRVYTRQILEGLEYLHVRNTIHRDIKGANVLVDNSGICKLTDFGTAKRISSIVESDIKYLPSIRGTVNWMAPEVIKQTTLGRFCDIWSVGCTVIEMATGKAPWSTLLKPDASCVSVLYQIAQAKSPPPIPKNLSNEALDFLKQCFKINPQERPNVIKLLNHKFISGVEMLHKQIEDIKPNKRNASAQSFFQRNFNSHSSGLMKNLKHKRNRFAPKNKSASSQGTNPDDNSQFSQSISNIKEPIKKEGARTQAKQVNKSKVSIYDFGMSFPLPQSKSGPFDSEARKSEGSSNLQTPEDNSLQKITKSGRSSILKDVSSNEETSKSGQISSLPGLGFTDRSEIDIIGTVRAHPNGVRTINTIQDEERDLEARTRNKFEHRRLSSESKARLRPLGRNKRALLKRLHYSDWSGDDSIGGNSFLLLGSPGTIQENSEDRGPHMGSGRGGNNSSLFTPNGSAFPWPETLSQIEENEITYDGRESSNHYHGKIEEEEEKDDAGESEQEIQEIRIESDEEQEQTERRNRRDNSRMNDSVYSNQQIYTLETLMSNEKDHINKEYQNLFQSTKLTNQHQKKRASPALVEDPSKLDRKLFSATGKFTGEDTSLVIDSIAVFKNKSTPGVTSNVNGLSSGKIIKICGDEGKKPTERGRVYQLLGQRNSHSQDPPAFDLLEGFTRKK